MVTITGANFDPIASNNIVFFGAVRAQVATATPTNLTISIFQNFSSPGNLSTNSSGPRTDLQVGNGPYDVAIADFDGDGKPDLAVSNNNASFVTEHHV